MKKKVGIIGAGVVGTAVGVVLSNKGYEITGVYDIKPESTLELVERTGCAPRSLPEEVSLSADILFITTSDTAIQEVVKRLADYEAFHPGQVVVHMSGAQTSEILDKAKGFGAHVLSVHPLQAFASFDQAVQNLSGSIFSIEGDKSAYDTATALVKAMEGEYFFIDKEAKPLYHAGACAVSNYVVTVINFGIKLLEASEIPRGKALRALRPLINGTIKNINNVGIPDALTGPIARGDLKTVLEHLGCLEKVAPELTGLYSWLGFYTASVAREKGTISAETMQEFQKLFREKQAGQLVNRRGPGKHFKERVDMARISAVELKEKKFKKEKITMLTSYDYSTAAIVDEAGIDVILVGDSLGNVVLGYENTLAVTMEDMLHHTKAVARGTKHAMVVGDMPFLSYHVSIEEAVRNAGRFVQEAGAQSVKLEGGSERVDTIKAILDAQIPVMGHIGLTPQSVHKLGGFKVQGKDLETARKLVEDAKALDKAGVFAIVLECVPTELARRITEGGIGSHDRNRSWASL